MDGLVSLTPKQAMFCELVARGSTYSDAYREAYGAYEWTNDSVNTASSRLMKEEKIADHVEQLRNHNTLARSVQDKLTREWVVMRLRLEALDKKNPGATRVRALQLVGADAGMWQPGGDAEPDKPLPTDEEAEKALEAFLRERLRKARTQGNVIDASPTMLPEKADD